MGDMKHYTLKVADVYLFLTTCNDNKVPKLDGGLVDAVCVSGVATYLVSIFYARLKIRFRYVIFKQVLCLIKGYISFCYLAKDQFCR